MYERFTDRARRVMQLANEEALRRNHQYIGTEHILLGMLRERSANVLKSLGVDLDTIVEKVDEIIQRGPNPVSTGKLPISRHAKRVVEYAIEDARSMNHHYVGSEHLLLGLLREHNGVAAQVLANLGIDRTAMRAEVENLLAQHPPKVPGLFRRICGWFSDVTWFLGEKRFFCL